MSDQAALLHSCFDELHQNLMMYSVRLQSNDLRHWHLEKPIMVYNSRLIWVEPDIPQVVLSDLNEQTKRTHGNGTRVWLKHGERHYNPEKFEFFRHSQLSEDVRYESWGSETPFFGGGLISKLPLLEMLLWVVGKPAMLGLFEPQLVLASWAKRNIGVMEGLQGDIDKALIDLLSALWCLKLPVVVSQQKWGREVEYLGDKLLNPQQLDFFASGLALKGCQLCRDNNEATKAIIELVQKPITLA